MSIPGFGQCPTSSCLTSSIGIGRVGFFPPFHVGSMLARLVGHPLKEFGFDFPASIKALTILDVNSANDFLLLADRANCL